MPKFRYQTQDIFYRQKGSGPLMIILPGNTASSACHQEDLSYYSKHFTSVSFDYLGTGQSDRLANFPDDWFSFCADQTASLIDKLNLGPAVLLGTSGGAVTALHTAALHPEKVRAVIADSFTPTFTEAMLNKSVIEDRARQTEGQVRFWRFAHGEDWEKVVEADTDMLRRLVARGGQWLDDVLEKIICPILFTASLADQSLMKPGEYTLEMLRKVHNGQAFISQKGSHPLIWTAPEIFRQAITGFLSQYD